ncbi:MAG: hypothetical protein GY820_41440, partial [Gammaproteobacteria bacterium]|nr:hypothetical protein [Gammaproteobacteria bacterium]
EVLYHPYWLKTEYADALDPKEPREIVRNAILFVRNKVRSIQQRIQRVADPYTKRPHHFTTMAKTLGGGILETLEPYVEDLEVSLVIDMYLIPPSVSMPRSMFDNWTGSRETGRRGCENHLELIKALFQSQAFYRANDWSYATVQRLLHFFVDWFVERRIPQLYEDLYNMAFYMTKGYLWRAIEGRAMHIRQHMDIKLPPFRYFGTPMD